MYIFSCVLCSLVFDTGLVTVLYKHVFIALWHVSYPNAILQTDGPSMCAHVHTQGEHKTCQQSQN